MTERPRMTVRNDGPHAVDPIAAFASQHIGDAESVEIVVEYEGHESEPDVLRVNRAGEVVAARSLNDA